MEQNYNFVEDVTPFGTKVRILPDYGTMYKLDENNKPAEIISGPLPIIDSYYDLVDIDFTQIKFMIEEPDGYLVATYPDQNNLKLKSMSSIWSTPDIEASSWMLSYDNNELRKRCLELANDGFTCVFSYCSPKLPNIINYDYQSLVLLWVVNNETGETVDTLELLKDPILRAYMGKLYQAPAGNSDQIRDDLLSTESIKGYIVELNDGTVFQIDTLWYTGMVDVKFSILDNKTLFEMIANNMANDLKPLFKDNLILERINDFEQVFGSYTYNSYNEIYGFLRINAGLDLEELSKKAMTYFGELDKYELYDIAISIYKGKYKNEEVMDIIAAAFVDNYEKYLPKKYEAKML